MRNDILFLVLCFVCVFLCAGCDQGTSSSSGYNFDFEPVFPENDEVVFDSTPTFEWSSKGWGYKYELTVGNEDSIIPPFPVETTNTSFTHDTALEDGMYYWYVTAEDEDPIDADILWSSQTDTWYFTIVLEGPTLLYPLSGETISDNSPTFLWSAPFDGVAKYEILIDDEESFSEPYVENEIEITSTYYTPVSPLDPGTYYWKVRAQNSTGNWGPWSETWSVIIE